VCVCVCERERENERGMRKKEKGGERELGNAGVGLRHFSSIEEFP